MSELNQPQTIENATIQRRALRTAVMLLVVAIGVILFYLFLIWQLKFWQIIVLASVMAAFSVATIISIRLIRRRQIDTGVWINIISLYPLGPATVLFVTDISLIIGLVFILLTSIVASQAFSGKRVRIATAISVAVAVLGVLIDQLPLDYRLTLPVLQVFIPIAAGTVIVIGGFFIVRRAMRGNLRTKLTVAFVLAAVTPLVVVGILASYQTYTDQLTQILKLESQVVNRVAEQVENFIFARENELRLLSEVGGLGTLPLEEQDALLSGLLSDQNFYDELILVDGSGKEQIYLSRIGIVTPEDLSSRTGSEEFERPKATGQSYFGPVTFDEKTGEPRMIIAIPILDLRTGELNNILIANLRFKTVWDFMAQADVSGSGIVYMINDTNQIVAHKNPSIVLQGTQVELPLEDSYTVGIDGTDVAMARTRIDLNEQAFSVIAEQPQIEATALAVNNLILTVGVIGLSMLGSAIFGVFVAGLIANPIRRLAVVAQSISEGDLSQEVEITSNDEIGDLAEAFNSMTTQLRNSIGSLEQQVSDRTQALETSAEVSRRLSTILDQNQLVREVVEQLRSAFGYYHAQIYLFDESKQNLVMAGGTGEAGRVMLAQRHQIEKGRGLVGRAANSNQAVLIPDVSRAIGWLPNPLLPDTKAEAAVPISIGDEVVGVLDVQQNVVGTLNEEDVSLIQSIANQVAVAVRNAQAFEQAQYQAIREAQVSNITQRIQLATTIEDVLKIAVRELGQALDAERADIELSMIQKSNVS